MRFWGAAIATVASLTIVSGASAVESTIYPGVGIGKVKLGMTLPQVQKALGRYEFVSQRAQVGGARYLEVGWAFGTWTVGFLGNRVALVATALHAQRTAQRIGPGSRWRALVKAYPRGTCWHADFGSKYLLKYVVTRQGGGQTIYWMHQRDVRTNLVPTETWIEVYEVQVRSRSGLGVELTPRYNQWACTPGWETRDFP